MSTMQPYAPGLAKSKKHILAPPPRSGTFSVYAHKLTAQAFVWLCSIVVWGNVANAAGIRNVCYGRCIVEIIFAALVWLGATIILCHNYYAERSPNSSAYFMEAQVTALLIFLWIPVIICISTYDGGPVVATWFAWLGLFGNIYATYKAYHSFKEEDLPSDLPDGYDEEDYVYG